MSHTVDSAHPARQSRDLLAKALRFLLGVLHGCNKNVCPEIAEATIHSMFDSPKPKATPEIPGLPRRDGVPSTLQAVACCQVKNKKEYRMEQRDVSPELYRNGVIRGVFYPR